MISKDLLEILACPIGKSPLREEDGKLVCTSCGARYRIEDDIPIMLIEEAELPDGVSSAEELHCGADRS
ncbi:Trm112 family protein [bacterium]|nr:Trm112 family protein [bacterium]